MNPKILSIFLIYSTQSAFCFLFKRLPAPSNLLQDTTTRETQEVGIRRLVRFSYIQEVFYRIYPISEIDIFPLCMFMLSVHKTRNAHA
jgi:hypothetical protein